VEAILEAAADLFADLGYARTTTNKIAERAGVSVGSLYQYFPNKDAVLAGLLLEHHEDVHRVLSESLGALADPRTDLESGLRDLMQRLVQLYLDRPTLTRALRADVLDQSSAGMHEHGKEEEFTDEVASVLARRPDIRPGDHRAMAAVLGTAAGTLTRWLVHDAPGDVPLATLLEESVQLLLRYLREDPPMRDPPPAPCS